MDNRSFGLNRGEHRVGDRAFAARLGRDFTEDLKQAAEISYERWEYRSGLERGPELVG